MADQYRQGHIMLIREPGGLPLSESLRPAEFTPGHVVLAHGESGREHVFKSEFVKIYQDGPDLFIEVAGEGALLEHPEHGDIAVDAGVYKLVDQREADPERRDSARRSFD